MAMLTIPFIFNYSLNDQLNLKDLSINNDFQTYGTFAEAISKLTSINIIFFLKWGLSLLSAAIIFNIINAIINEFTKGKGWLEGSISLVTTFGMISLFHFGIKLEYMVGTFLVLFGAFLGLLTILRSRRRYAILYGLVNISIWMFEPKLFLAMLVLSLIIVISYIILGKNKPTLFVVQFISPSLIVSALWLYPFSTLGALSLVILGVLLYAFMVSSGRVHILDKFDRFITKNRYILSAIIFTIIILSAIIYGVVNEHSAKSIMLYDSALWSTFNSNVFNDIQKWLYYSIIIFILLITVYNVYISKALTTRITILILISASIIIGYSPIVRILTINSILGDQFEFLKMISIAPITISLPIILSRTIWREYVKTK